MNFVRTENQIINLNNAAYVPRNDNRVVVTFCTAKAKVHCISHPEAQMRTNCRTYIIKKHDSDIWPRFIGQVS